MKEILMIIIASISLLYIGDTTISFHPFSIRMESWRLVIGFILIAVGSLFVVNNYYNKGYRDGINKVTDIIEEETIKIKDGIEI
jgi:hypothetical protein